MVLPDRSVAAAAFARRLHALSLNRSTGLVTLRSPARRFQMVLVDGSVVAGIGGSAAVADRGIARRLADALRWEALWCSFEPCACSRELPRASVREPAGALLLRAAELAVDADDRADKTCVAPQARLQLSRFGRSLLDSGVALLSREMAAEWRDGMLASQLLAADMSRSRLRSALFIEAIVPETSSSRRSYPLLLRKHRQLRSTTNPYQLLELAPDADAASAGKALRHFAARLHPDALGPDTPPAVRALTCELFAALASAEHALRHSRLRG